MQDRNLLADRVHAGTLHPSQDVDAPLGNLLRIGARDDVRNDDGVVGAEGDVLREVRVLNEAPEIERNPLLVADDVRGGEVRPRGRPTGESQCLQHGRAGLDGIDAGTGDLADEEDTQAPDLADDHRNVRISHRLAQLRREELGELRGRQPTGTDLAHQRKGDLAVGANGHGLIQLLVVPHLDVQHVVVTDHILPVAPGRTPREQHRGDGAQDQEQSDSSKPVVVLSHRRTPVRLFAQKRHRCHQGSIFPSREP